MDSTIPYIYLPLDACKQFEAAFGISWNDNAQAYLVNNSLHDSLQTLNAKVDFVVSNSSDVTSSDNLVTITLPYAAFDLIAEYPLAENSTRYFPLVRATNESQYTLGRTFLQEAYIIADYERRNFSISQCSWVEGAAQRIIPILSPDQPRPPKSVNIGLIVGMVVIGVSILLALSILFIWWWRRRAKRLREDKDSIADSKTAELGDESTKERYEIEGKGHLSPEIDGKGVFGEIDGSPLPGKELEGDHGAQEMNSGETPAHEMNAKETPATELPA